jgi:hypothetical protein
METTLNLKLLNSIKDAQEKLSKLSSKQKLDLEKTWDIEHAYYSSVLEGCKLDKKDFEKLGEEIE